MRPLNLPRLLGRIKLRDLGGGVVQIQFRGRRLTAQIKPPPECPTVESVLEILLREELIYLDTPGGMQGLAVMLGLNGKKGSPGVLRTRRLYQALQVRHRKLRRLLGPRFDQIIVTVRQMFDSGEHLPHPASPLDKVRGQPHHEGRGEPLPVG